MLLLTSARVGQRDLVAKNVTHRVVYDQALPARVVTVKHATPGLWLIHQGMERYLRHRQPRKMFHDPLAAGVPMPALEPPPVSRSPSITTGLYTRSSSTSTASGASASGVYEDILTLPRGHEAAYLPRVASRPCR